MAAEVRRSSCSDGSSASGGDSQVDVSKLLRSFRSNFEALSEEIDAEKHLNFLFQEEVLESNEIEQVYAAGTPRKMTSRMLYILWAKKDENWIKTFIESLLKCDYSKKIAEKLLLDAGS